DGSPSFRGAGEISVPLAATPSISNGEPVVLGIRPEHLRLSEAGIPVTVAVVEPTGSETLVFVRFGEGEMVALFRERHDFKPGDTLKLRPRLDHIHLFDAETGKRL
ncbi:TOBE domain-containing protein, partial [Mesorhizobium sp. M1C.F.Ca.ET.210.01.1.1]|uniref:TOBE domain-containing protein n=1 Tax=Mesorhizobium sp. M1C.F.Ca.ET.210.01.1.1 TaxID=2563930 RepID=UPI001092875A